MSDYKKGQDKGPKKFSPKKFSRDPTSIRKVDESLVNGLLAQVLKGDMGSLRDYVSEHNVSMNLTDKNGDTPLHILMRMEDSQINDNARRAMTDYMIMHGVPVNAFNKRNETALHLAAKRQQYDIVQILLENHANPNAENDQRMTPLHYMAQGLLIPLTEDPKLEPLIPEPEVGKGTINQLALDINQFLVNQLKKPELKMYLDHIRSTLQKTLEYVDDPLMSGYLNELDQLAKEIRAPGKTPEQIRETISKKVSNVATNVRERIGNIHEGLFKKLDIKAVEGSQNVIQDLTPEAVLQGRLNSLEQRRQMALGKLFANIDKMGKVFTDFNAQFEDPKSLYNPLNSLMALTFLYYSMFIQSQSPDREPLVETPFTGILTDNRIGILIEEYRFMVKSDFTDPDDRPAIHDFMDMNVPRAGQEEIRTLWSYLSGPILTFEGDDFLKFRKLVTENSVTELLNPERVPVRDPANRIVGYRSVIFDDKLDKINEGRIEAQVNAAVPENSLFTVLHSWIADTLQVRLTEIQQLAERIAAEGNYMDIIALNNYLLRFGLHTLVITQMEKGQILGNLGEYESVFDQIVADTPSPQEIVANINYEPTLGKRTVLDFVRQVRAYYNNVILPQAPVIDAAGNIDPIYNQVVPYLNAIINETNQVPVLKEPFEADVTNLGQQIPIMNYIQQVAEYAQNVPGPYRPIEEMVYNYANLAQISPDELSNALLAGAIPQVADTVAAILIDPTPVDSLVLAAVTDAVAARQGYGDILRAANRAASVTSEDQLVIDIVNQALISNISRNAMLDLAQKAVGVYRVGLTNVRGDTLVRVQTDPVVRAAQKASVDKDATAESVAKAVSRVAGVDPIVDALASAKPNISPNAVYKATAAIVAARDIVADNYTNAIQAATIVSSTIADPATVRDVFIHVWTDELVKDKIANVVRDQVQLFKFIDPVYAILSADTNDANVGADPIIQAIEGATGPRANDLLTAANGVAAAAATSTGPGLTNPSSAALNVVRILAALADPPANDVIIQAAKLATAIMIQYPGLNYSDVINAATRYATNPAVVDARRTNSLDPNTVATAAETAVGVGADPFSQVAARAARAVANIFASVGTLREVAARAAAAAAPFTQGYQYVTPDQIHQAIIQAYPAAAAAAAGAPPLYDPVDVSNQYLTILQNDVFDPIMRNFDSNTIYEAAAQAAFPPAAHHPLNRLQAARDAAYKAINVQSLSPSFVPLNWYISEDLMRPEPIAETYGLLEKYARQKLQEVRRVIENYEEVDKNDKNKKKTVKSAFNKFSDQLSNILDDETGIYSDLNQLIQLTNEESGINFTNFYLYAAEQNAPLLRIPKIYSGMLPLIPKFPGPDVPRDIANPEYNLRFFPRVDDPIYYYETHGVTGINVPLPIGDNGQNQYRDVNNVNAIVVGESGYFLPGEIFGQDTPATIGKRDDHLWFYRMKNQEENPLTAAVGNASALGGVGNYAKAFENPRINRDPGIGLPTQGPHALTVISPLINQYLGLVRHHLVQKFDTTVNEGTDAEIDALKKQVLEQFRTSPGFNEANLNRDIRITIADQLDELLNTYFGLLANDAAQTIVREYLGRNGDIVPTVDIYLGQMKDRQFSLDLSKAPEFILDKDPKYWEYEAITTEQVNKKTRRDPDKSNNPVEFQVYEIDYYSDDLNYRKKGYLVDRKLVPLMHQYEADVNHKDINGNTPIYYSITVQYYHMIEAFLDHFARYTKTTNNLLKTPFGHATELYRVHNRYMYHENPKKVVDLIAKPFYKRFEKTILADKSFNNNMVVSTKVAFHEAALMYMHQLFQYTYDFKHGYSLRDRGKLFDLFIEANIMDSEDKDFKKGLPMTGNINTETLTDIVRRNKILHVLVDKLDKLTKKKDKLEKTVETLTETQDSFSEYADLLAGDPNYKVRVNQRKSDANEELKRKEQDLKETEKSIKIYKMRLENASRVLLRDIEGELDNLRNSPASVPEAWQGPVTYYRYLLNNILNKDYRIYHNMWIDQMKSDQASPFFIHIPLIQLQAILINSLETQLNDDYDNFTVSHNKYTELKDSFETLEQFYKRIIYDTLRRKEELPKYLNNNPYRKDEFNILGFVLDQVLGQKLLSSLKKLMMRFYEVTNSSKVLLDDDDIEESILEDASEKIETTLKQVGPSGYSLTEFLIGKDSEISPLSKKVLLQTYETRENKTDPKTEVVDISQFFNEIKTVLLSPESPLPVKEDDNMILYLDKKLVPFYQKNYVELAKGLRTMIDRYDKYLWNDYQNIKVINLFLDRIVDPKKIDY